MTMDDRSQGGSSAGGRRPPPEGECTIPVPMPATELSNFVTPQPEQRVRCV